MFSNNGSVVAHFTTGEPSTIPFSPFNQLNLNGSFSGKTISGTYEIDNGQGTDGTFQLTKHDNTAGTWHKMLPAINLLLGE